MKCPNCGKELNKKTNFCQYCGYKFGSAPTSPTHPSKQPTVQPTKQPIVQPTSISDNGASKNGMKIALIIISIICIIGIIGAIGAVMYIKLNNNEAVSSLVTEDVSEDNQVNDVEEEQTFEDITTEPVEETPTTEAAPEMTMDYCNNSFCDVKNNLTDDDFVQVSDTNNNYYFSYPKYVFNNFSYSDEDGYYFSYEENGNITISMRVYSYDQSGDPIENAKSLKQRLKDDVYEVSYEFPKDVAKHGVGDDGIMQVVVSGWTSGSHNEQKYSCVGNDGQKTYVFEVVYPDYDLSSEVEHFDYIVDCVYHLCSFSGSTKPAYSNYDSFVKALGN